MRFSLSAVVVAAGRSERFQQVGSTATLTQKVFVEWGGKPLIRHTIDALRALDLSEIVIVSRPEVFSVLQKIFSDIKDESRLFWVEGGVRRQDSVRAGLRALKPCDRVLIHDGARPFLQKEFLIRLFQESQKYEGAIPAAPVVETLKKKTADGFIAETVNRGDYFRAQTPQFFKFDLISQLHEKIANEEREFTDDAAILEHFGYRVKLVEGSPENIKVTVPEDLRSRGIHV